MDEEHKKLFVHPRKEEKKNLVDTESKWLVRLTVKAKGKWKQRGKELDNASTD